MFFRKAKEIERLNNLLRLKESERRLEYIKANEARKQLAAALHEASTAKKRNALLEAARGADRDALEKFEAQRAALDQEIKRQRHERYEAFMKQRKTIEKQKAKIETLESNLDAMNFTMAQNSEIYTDLCLRYTALNERMKSYEAIDRLLKGSK